MRNLLVISWFTLREAFARKVFIFFLIISLLVIIGLILLTSLISSQSLVQGIAQSHDKTLIGNIASTLEFIIISPLSSLCLLLAIFSSSSFVPNMMEKGNIDLLLSKPVSRDQLLWGKYFGGVLIVFLNIAFLIIGVWFIISLKFSHWDVSFLLITLIITFAFAVLYSIIVLFGIVTKNAIFGMMLAYFVFLILSPLLHFLHSRVDIFIDSKFLKEIISFLYYVIPKISELMGSNLIDIASGKGIVDLQPIISSFLFLIFMMSASVWIFRKKDF
jgi:ABC-type transport system involved in multi-copper enzyme maturation permease subunit